MKKLNFSGVLLNRKCADPRFSASILIKFCLFKILFIKALSLDDTKKC